MSPFIGREKIGPKVSSWIRNLTELGVEPPEINSKKLIYIENSIPEYNPSDKQYLFLRNLSRKSKYPGDNVFIIPEYDYSLGWALSPEEILFYIRFLVERNLVSLTERNELVFSQKTNPISLEITPCGWEYLDKYEQRAIELSQAYVAMSCSKSMNVIWEKAIKPAVNDAGYKAIRFETTTQDNNYSMNTKVISVIRDSLFVIAEITDRTPVVYFEGGYALGRNLPVIWCAKVNDLKNSVHHFDSGGNLILWETFEDLKDKLYDNICVVVGRRKII